MTPEEVKVLNYFNDNEDILSFVPPVGSPHSPYSVVIVTRNRAPFSKTESIRNPLIWATDSVIAQKIKPKEIIIIDDCSDLPPKDFTKDMIEVIDKKCNQVNIVLKYHRNDIRKNAAISRNIAAELAETNTLFVLDDDVVLKETASYGLYIYEAVMKADEKLFAVNLPLTTRISHPAILVESKDVGRIDEGNLRITSNLISRFPKEYIEKQKLIKIGDLELWKPLMLQNFQAGSVLIKKDVLQALGGFPHFDTPIMYGEETGLAIRAIQKDYKIYYFPYINLSGIHFSYGNSSGRQDFGGFDWLENKGHDFNLKQMVAESVIERLSSGMRTRKEIYFYTKIRNFACILEELKKGLGFDKWAEKSYQDFVEKNETSFLDSKGSIDGEELRKLIWQTAIENAKSGTFLSEQQLLEHWGIK